MKALILHIPVLHEGYVRLLEAHKNIDVLILGRSFTGTHRPLVKDIRAMDPELVQLAIQSWNSARSVKILELADISALNTSSWHITMPDEELSRLIAERHLNLAAVSFDPIFLRWDRRNAIASEKVLPDRVISENQLDIELMGRAGRIARPSSDIYRRVGAVAARGQKPLIWAYNRATPSEHSPWVSGDPRNDLSIGVGIEVSMFLHAEAGVVAEAAKRGVSLAGASLYVTTFPCPLCAKIVASAGITKCYYSTGYGVLDAQGVLEAAGIEVIQVESIDSDDNTGSLPYPSKKVPLQQSHKGVF